jgi:CRP-like cAMP-binding protein
MEPREYISHPEIRHFVKKYSAGQYLFSQGQIATTMIVIIEGRIQLIREKEGEPHIANLLDVGSFLGEKIILGGKPYQRAFSAKAETDALCVEMTANDLEFIQEKAPEILTDLLKRVVAGIGERFDRANFLIRALRSSNNTKRLLRCILYLSRTTGKKLDIGIEVNLSAASLNYYVDMDLQSIEAVLNHLVAMKLLIHETEDFFLITSEQNFVAYIAALDRRQAA